MRKNFEKTTMSTIEQKKCGETWTNIMRAENNTNLNKDENNTN